MTGEPPLEYPFLEQQIEEKQNLRDLSKDIAINRYLEDSDSDFDDFSSVASDQVQHYEEKYRGILGKAALEMKKQPVKFHLPDKTREYIQRQ